MDGDDDDARSVSGCDDDTDSYLDWGALESFKAETGTGECAA